MNPKKSYAVLKSVTIPFHVSEDVSCAPFPVQQNNSTTDVLAAAKVDVICFLEGKFQSSN